MERLKLVGAESLRSLGANVSTTLAATVTVLIGMFLLGVFIAFGSWVVSWSNHVKKELVVHVYYCTADTCAKPVTAAQEETDRGPRDGEPAGEESDPGAPRPRRCAR